MRKMGRGSPLPIPYKLFNYYIYRVAAAPVTIAGASFIYKSFKRVIKEIRHTYGEISVNSFLNERNCLL